MSIMNKLKKGSTLKHSEVLSESGLFSNKDVITTDIPALNIALSGSINGGYGPGLMVFAGPSKHFKSLFTLIIAKAYMDKYPEAVMLFYDSEFGTPSSYFEAVGIDPARVFHTPITDIEQLKFDLTAQLNNIERGDRVFIAIDSVGNLASLKEVEDAEAQKSAADMSRAKALKSLFRIVTPHLTLKNIPMVVVNHTYKEMCLAGTTPVKVVGTESGIKQLKDIEVGDRVYGTTGIQTVTHTYSPEQLDGSGKEFLQLMFDDGSVVDCTGDHLFLTKENGWVEAGDLDLGTLMA